MRRRRGWCILVMAACCAFGAGRETIAANLSDFMDIKPYVEVQTTYNDNVYEINDDAALPEDAEKREDMSLDARIGVDANISLDRPVLSIGAGIRYAFQYSKFLENTELDDARHDLDFDFTFSSNYEEGILQDRVKILLNDVLSFIPIDEEEPLLSGNTSIRNNFLAGLDYKIVSSRRLNFIIGYAYNRLDYFEDDPITVVTVPGIEDGDVLTQESQTHTARAELSYVMNPRLTASITYDYALTTREEEPGVLVSANFDRHNVLAGLQAKFTPRMHGTVKGGYTLTSFDPVAGSGQDDQSDFVTEASLSANFAHQPLMTIGYRRYYVENDFGDTLLTDNAFTRMGFRLAPGFMVNVTGDYILEGRDLLGDETTQKIFGIDAELELLRNLSFLAAYNYREKDFFAQNFLGREEREETNHVVSSGFQYKVGQYFQLKGLYTYTDKGSNVAEQEFNRNQFTATGKVTF